MISTDLEARLREVGGQVESIDNAGAGWQLTARFHANDATCPRCSSSFTSRYGWRQAKFHDCPANDGLPVLLTAWRPRISCNDCGSTFVADVPYLLNYGQLTLGMQRHLASEILNYPSVRALAGAKELSAKTVMAALKMAVKDAQLRACACQTVVVRSLRIGRRAYWLGIDPLSLQTLMVTTANESSDLEDLVCHIARLSPSRIDLPANPKLATLLKHRLPETRLTISIQTICELTEETLRDYVMRLSYRLRNEGLVSVRAIRLCSTSAEQLMEHERRLFSTLASETPFWGAYEFKERFVGLLGQGKIACLQAIQESMESTVDASRPVFLPMYRQLTQLDDLGVEFHREATFDAVQSKLNQLKVRLGKQGTRFELPLLYAIISLFFVGFGRPNLVRALKQTLIELRDAFVAPMTFSLSDAECCAVLFNTTDLADHKTSSCSAIADLELPP